MPKPLATTTPVLAAALIVLAILPIASASAAEPWWQLLPGSRPTNMSQVNNATETQEVSGEKFGTAFGSPTMYAVAVEVGGKTVGCLGSGDLSAFGIPNPNADEFCYEETGYHASETAGEFQTMLEGPYGSGNVEVTGGPAGDAPFIVESPWGPPIELTALKFFGVYPMGEGVSSKATSEGSGRLAVTVTNLGDEFVDGTSTPVTIIDKLPPGAIAYGVEGAAPHQGFQPGTNGTVRVAVECVIKAADEVACTYAGKVRPFEAIEVEVLTALTSAPSGEGEITVSGANARPVSVGQSINFSDHPVKFGIEQFSAIAEEEGGAPASQAGSHPFQFTNTIQFNVGRVHSMPYEGEFVVGARHLVVEQPALPRNLRFPLPAGFIGNAEVLPQCEMTKFFEGGFLNKCPRDAILGISSVTIVEKLTFGLMRFAVPVFNLPPAHGEPARFGFTVMGAPVIIDTSVDPENDNRIIASVRNTSQVVEFLSATTTFWGTPGDPRHDNARGWNCVYQAPTGPCERPPNLGETPFLRLPVQCSSPLDYGFSLEPWNVPVGSEVESTSFLGEQLRGCNRLPFNPSVNGAPTSKLAESPSGFDFQLTMPNSGLLNPKAIAEGQPKKVEFTLPEGMSLNPSDGEGLVGCTEAEYARETASSKPGEGCPNAAKIGTVDVSTPLLDEEAHGALYVAAPYDNPGHSLVGLYIVARIPDRGIVVKQFGRVETDPNTGQLTTIFDDLPQLPYSSFHLHFREGGRAPLVTPPACGTYQGEARFIPWSAQDPNNPAPDEIIRRTVSFNIEHGVDGGSCPSGGLPPFHPQLNAGTRSNAAGSFSPFDIRLSRSDGEQEFTNFSIKLPPGIAGKLAGIPLCSDAQIAQAKSRTGPHGGQEELDDPSCPAASQVGRTLAGAGVGSVLTYAPGKIYLAGPYHGAPVSIVSITSGVVGPFDIGTVVVRQALKVNPETGEVFLDSTGSDPIPHIVKGIVLHVRDIRAYVDRPEFTFNPTSCEPTSTAATVLGSGLDFASPTDDNPFVSTSRFQAADCAALPFRPKLKLTLKGSTKRAGNPSLHAHLSMHGFGEAGVAFAQVALPKSEFLDNAHIQTVCTRVQFKQGAREGEDCPPGSLIGRAKAVTPILSEPLTGNVYLRSNPERELPDIAATLQGQEIDITLVGHTDSSKGGGLRNTFEVVPDAPVNSFDLTLFGGKRGLLENAPSRGNSICGTHLKALAKFTGHNGKTHNGKVALRASGCRKHHKHHKHRSHKHHRHARRR